MLVLSRKFMEKIQIGNNITITVCQIDRGKVRIGIDAPKDVVVDRHEIYLTKKANAATKEVVRQAKTG